MTKNELRKMAREMEKKLTAEFDVALEKMIKSGCVDLPSTPCDYSLIKNFTVAFCEDCASEWGYKPRRDTKKGRENLKQIQNIRNFI